MAEMGNSSKQDRISNLPDSLIHHIFSFSDMKYAVQTCVLSKRWMYVWKSLLTLNLDCYVHWSPARRSGDGLIHFLDKVFSLRDRSDIQRFQLCCSDMHINISSVQVYRWIASAVSLNVQDLCIDINHIRGDFEIPSCLATCKSLSKLELVLTLRHFEDRKKIILPITISLPRLKSLCLSLRSLAFDDENSVTEFSASCPALESLKLFCEFSNMNLIVSLPQLKQFIYSEIENNDNIKLCAPNLMHLSFGGCISSDYTLENLASLTAVNIFMFVKETEDSVPEKHWKISAEKKGLYANKMMKLLRGLYNVKDLRLSAYILKDLSGDPNMLGSQSHQLYHYLRTLKLRTWLTKGCLHSVTYLLWISPRIESLSLELSEGLFNVQCLIGGYLDFDEVTFDSEILGNNMEAWLSLPCMIDHLKYAEIQGVRGCLNELKFLEFLLTNAVALEKLDLTPCLRCSKQEVLMKFHEKLLRYLSASKDTKILLESEQIL